MNHCCLTGLMNYFVVFEPSESTLIRFPLMGIKEIGKILGILFNLN